MSDTDQGPAMLHGSCVDVGGAGVLIFGASGSGKSTLALRLLALGARLVADDQVTLTRLDGETLRATCPETIKGMIESRGIGLISAETVDETVIKLCVDLDQTELHRLPPHRTHEILGVSVNTVHGRDNPALDVGLLALLKGVRLK